MKKKYLSCGECGLPKSGDQIYNQYCKLCGYKHRTRPKGLKYKLIAIRPPVSLTTRQKMSLIRKGKHLSKETREKLKGHKPWNKGLKGKQIAWNKGIIYQAIRNEKHPHWKGDDVGYEALHNWVSNRLGKPDTCEFCLKDGLFAQKIHWANKSHKYERKLTDWLRLCASCHKIYDLSYKRFYSVEA